MMSSASTTSLASIAALVAVVHTLAGPDHYLPFIAMSRVGRWSLPKTLVVTVLCGLAHVISSIMIGLIGVGLGFSATQFGWLESLRGRIAAWMLLGFGLAYTAWGIRHAIRNRPHTHRHVHVDGTVHCHKHVHDGPHCHAHVGRLAPAHVGDPDEAGRTVAGTDSAKIGAGAAGEMTPWILFAVFVFGPCEPLIPILMYSAAELGPWSAAAVMLVFGVATVASMVLVVSLAFLGCSRVSVPGLSRYGHVAAGMAITGCGVAVTIGW